MPYYYIEITKHNDGIIASAIQTITIKEDSDYIKYFSNCQSARDYLDTLTFIDNLSMKFCLKENITAEELYNKVK